MGEYKLSASLQGHEDDVRAVSFAGEQAIISASRDATVRLWQRTPAGSLVFDESIAVHGSEFINSCTFVPSSAEYPNGLIVSAGKESIIDVRPPGRPPESDAERLLLGHQSNVCSLDVSPDRNIKTLISGSWDASAMIWDIEKGEATAVLEGHQGSVWAVLVYDHKHVITGCADKLIRVWTTAGKLLNKIEGSTDVVRALCRTSDGSAANFASAGNDAVIRLWTLEGQQIAQLHGHESFVYQLALLPNGDLASASEDRTLRIWRGTECTQTITHPAISVWSVAVCAENGDVVTGASDKVVRVFSKDPARQADPETIKAFDDAVKGSAIPQQQVPDINKEKLPGPEFLQQKSGTKEGQVQMIREPNGNVTAHQWSAGAQQWVNVGTVVDAAGSDGRKTSYKGKEYDYVFDVDIKDGEPALKLPYNVAQNPYETAQKFIIDNELPITYVDQVANFIITNTQGASIGQGQGAQQEAPDPWGSSARYRPGDDQQTTSAPPPQRSAILPQRKYLTIATANFAQMFKKINELNTKLVSDGKTDIAFDSKQISLLSSLSTELERVIESGEASTSEILDLGVDMAIHMITVWPQESRIPGLDLYRCLCAATPAVATRFDVQKTSTQSDAIYSIAPGHANANTTMLSIRAYVNLFNHEAGRTALDKDFSIFWATIVPFIQPPSAPTSSRNNADKTVRESGIHLNRNVHIAVTTWCINFAIMTILGALNMDDMRVKGPKQMDGEDLQYRAWDVSSNLVAFVADPKVTDSETIYRALVALGTMMGEPRLAILDVRPGRTIKKEIVKSTLNKVERTVREPRMKQLVEEIREFL